MANEEHLSLLRQGVETWNEWRYSNLRIRPELIVADLSQADLSGTYLNGAYLGNANLTSVDLSHADMSEVDLTGARLGGANLQRARLRKAKLSGAYLAEADLRDTDMREAYLSEANLTRVHLFEADLSGANLSKASLIATQLIKADLTGADLSEASLYETLIEKTGLVGTRFEAANVSGAVFADVDLSCCTGLESVKHKGPSTLGVDSIIRSKGQIPNAFLRGVGLPNEWIEYIPSLVSEAIQFFSCFISYSSVDMAFAVRLYDVLQAKGIRCWLDEKQLLPGDDISRQLERGIHLWDKFLLCGSQNSLTSWWVEGEIKTCLEKERTLQKERGNPVLKVIPLNLDGYMFTDQWNLGLFAKQITSRVAADFRGWDKPGFNFDEQVAKVIKALRADESAREGPPPSKL